MAQSTDASLPDPSLPRTTLQRSLRTTQGHESSPCTANDNLSREEWLPQLHSNPVWPVASPSTSLRASILSKVAILSTRGPRSKVNYLWLPQIEVIKKEKRVLVWDSNRLRSLESTRDDTTQFHDTSPPQETLGKNNCQKTPDEKKN